ncbi:hypothetical protein, partial [Mesorhizobium sp.]|uniref:hypothetical protein n=1 Tax=Mesorhizobium sp. TaxID=1871066 RepID=UPI00257BFF2F
MASNDLVTLTATITDGDGDQDDDTVNIGTSLVFKDDAPTITATGVPPTLTVDESNFLVDASADFS